MYFLGWGSQKQWRQCCAWTMWSFQWFAFPFNLHPSGEIDYILQGYINNTQMGINLLVYVKCRQNIYVLMPRNLLLKDAVKHLMVLPASVYLTEAMPQCNCLNVFCFCKIVSVFKKFGHIKRKQFLSIRYWLLVRTNQCCIGESCHWVPHGFIKPFINHMNVVLCSTMNTNDRTEN